MAVELIFAPVRATDANGDAIPGALANFYESGTTSPITVYTTAALDVAHANPVAADAGGHFPQVFHGGSPAAKVVLTTSAAASVYTLDPCPAVGLGAGAASDIAFSPTVALPFTNVQAAVEGAAASAASGFIPYGLAVDGTAAQVTDKDATTIPAGSYRTDTGTSAGTFPSGSVAADGGILTTWRRTATSAVEWFMPADKDKWFARRLATTWQAFREFPTVTAGAARGALIRMGASNWESVALGTSGQVFGSDGTDAVWQSHMSTSTDLSIPSAGSIATAFNHGFGAVPSMVTLQLVCAVAELGYSVGDVTDGHWFVGGTSSDIEHNFSYRANTTQVICRLGDSFGLAVMNSGGDKASATPTSWRLRITAHR